MNVLGIILIIISYLFGGILVILVWKKAIIKKLMMYGFIGTVFGNEHVLQSNTLLPISYIRKKGRFIAKCELLCLTSYGKTIEYAYEDLEQMILKSWKLCVEVDASTLTNDKLYTRNILLRYFSDYQRLLVINEKKLKAGDLFWIPTVQNINEILGNVKEKSINEKLYKYWIELLKIGIEDNIKLVISQMKVELCISKKFTRFVINRSLLNHCISFLACGHVKEVLDLLEKYLSDKRYCRICGCSDHVGCSDGCSWLGANLCSNCMEIKEK